MAANFGRSIVSHRALDHWPYISNIDLKVTKSMVLGSKATLNGSGCVFALSVNASESMGEDGLAEILNAQCIKAAFKNTELNPPFSD